MIRFWAAAFLVALLAAPGRAADPPLVGAIKAGQGSVKVKALLAGGARIGDKDQYGWTASMWAVGHADAATVSALLAAGGDLAAAPGFNPMVEAAKGGRSDVVALLAAKSFDCNAKDDRGRPALDYAVALSSTDTTAALLDCKADVNGRDAHGATPLISAVEMGQNAQAAFLLSHGAQPDLRDGNGFTALMWAARDGRADLVKTLLAGGATATLKSVTGQTAHAIAAARGFTDAADLLP